MSTHSASRPRQWHQAALLAALCTAALPALPEQVRPPLGTAGRSSALEFTAHPAPASPGDGGVEPVTLPSAQARALGLNPAVQEATAQATVAGFGVLQAHARHLPTVETQGGVPVGGGRSGTVRSLNMTLNLWSGGALQARAQQSRQSFEAQRQKLFASCAAAVEAVDDAYVAALRARALAHQADSNLAKLDDLLGMVREIAQIDSGRRSDIEVVLARRQAARSAQLDVLALVQQADSALKRHLSADIRPTTEGLMAWAAQGLATALPQAQSEAERASASLRAAHLERQAAEKGVMAAKAATKPAINLVASRIQDHQTGGPRNDHRVMLQAQWAAFNGGQDHLAALASEQGIAVANSRIEELRRSLFQEVAAAWAAREAARARLELAPLQGQAVQAVLATHTELFRLGRRSVLDLLSATQEVHLAQVAAIDAEHDLLRKQLQLASLTGLSLARLQLPAQHPCGTGAAPLPDAGLPFPLPGL